MNRFTKLSLASFFVVSSTLLFSACTSKTEEATPSNMNSNNSSQTNTVVSPTVTGNYQDETIVGLKTKYGQIVIKLYQKEAPKTVANFLKKVNSGAYNGLTFHRVEPSFVVQGGDPLGNGTGGGKITSEINTIPFKRGSVGLARGPIKEESNDSQFYICLADESCSHLTNEYVNFGEVISGMEFVDKITVGDKILELSSQTK